MTTAVAQNAVGAATLDTPCAVRTCHHTAPLVPCRPGTRLIAAGMAAPEAIDPSDPRVLRCGFAKLQVPAQTHKSSDANPLDPSIRAAKSKCLTCLLRLSIARHRSQPGCAAVTPCSCRPQSHICTGRQRVPVLNPQVRHAAGAPHYQRTILRGFCFAIQSSQLSRSFQYRATASNSSSKSRRRCCGAAPPARIAAPIASVAPSPQIFSLSL